MMSGAHGWKSFPLSSARQKPVSITLLESKKKKKKKQCKQWKRSNYSDRIVVPLLFIADYRHAAPKWWQSTGEPNTNLPGFCFLVAHLFYSLFFLKKKKHTEWPNIIKGPCGGLQMQQQSVAKLEEIEDVCVQELDQTEICPRQITPIPNAQVEHFA